MTEKKKILVLSDHPLSPSGVGTQTKYMIEALLKTERYKFVCLGGAIKHQNYQPQSVEPYGHDWIIYPIDGYGSDEMIRSILQKEKPDVLWFMTDPRFYGWLWEIENEVRPNVPMVYYHVWDNFPAPHYNGKFYRSTDEVLCISKVTHQIVQAVSPEVSSTYLPHAVNNNAFKQFKDKPTLDRIQDLRRNLSVTQSSLKNPNKKIFFWNNRNARRKQSGSLIYWFKDFLDQVGHDKAALIMHTNPQDGYGQDLGAIIHQLGLTNGEVLFSTDKVNMQQLGMMYNFADCTINISDAEGFGLATLESLSCGTPIIVNMTGGLQEQVTDGKSWFGIGLEPDSKAVIGSQEVPYIYEDRLNGKKVVSALRSMYAMPKEDLEIYGRSGREHVLQNYNWDVFKQTWVDLMLKIHEEEGSWDTRNYKNYRLLEVA